MQLAIEGGGGLVLPPQLRVPGQGGIPLVLAGRHGGGRRRKDKVQLGAKPVMWEVWMDKETDEEDEDEEGSSEKRVHSATVQPVSMTLVRPTLPDPTNPNSRRPTSASPIMLTRETAQEYFGIDMRSFREVVHDNWRNTRSNLQSFSRTLAPRPSSIVIPSPQRSRPTSQRVNSNYGTPNRQSGVITPEEDDDMEKRLAVGFLIAMPDARRPTYNPATQSTQHLGVFKVDLDQPSPTSDTFPYSAEELERGKMKALEVGGDEDGFTGNFGIDDGELPPVVFGIVDVDWTGQKVPSSMAEKPQTGSGGTHA
ncbi:hypothetical protein FRC04_000951 [Tulasnella sp. 424]|nr:hypothetical protein FRC04_000951 [Tulasnella sp. 424]